MLLFNPYLGGGSKGRDCRISIKGISTNVNVIARLELELAYFKAAIQHFSHYAMGTSLSA